MLSSSLTTLILFFQGGFQFYISLTEELPDEVKSGVAHFQGVADVRVQKLNPFTLSGIVPRK